MALNDALGVTGIAKLTGPYRTGIPVTMLCRPNACSSAAFDRKGVNTAAAKPFFAR